MAAQVLQLGLAGSEQTLPSDSRKNEQGAPELISIDERAVDGKLHTDFVTLTDSWTISWSRISDTDYQTIRSIIGLQISTPSFLSFKYTDAGGTFTTVEVKATIASLGTLLPRDEYFYSGFSIFLEQVS